MLEIILIIYTIVSLAFFLKIAIGIPEHGFGYLPDILWNKRTKTGKIINILYFPSWILAIIYYYFVTFMIWLFDFLKNAKWY